MPTKPPTAEATPAVVIRCRKCGRKLTDPVSQQRMIGPDCAGGRLLRRRRRSRVQQPALFDTTSPRENPHSAATA